MLLLRNDVDGLLLPLRVTYIPAPTESKQMSNNYSIWVVNCGINICGLDVRISPTTFITVEALSVQNTDTLYVCKVYTVKSHIQVSPLFWIANTELDKNNSRKKDGILSLTFHEALYTMI